MDPTGCEGCDSLPIDPTTIVDLDTEEGSEFKKKRIDVSLYYYAIRQRDYKLILKIATQYKLNWFKESTKLIHSDACPFKIPDKMKTDILVLQNPMVFHHSNIQSHLRIPCIQCSSIAGSFAMSLYRIYYDNTTSNYAIRAIYEYYKQIKPDKINEILPIACLIGSEMYGEIQMAYAGYTRGEHTCNNHESGDFMCKWFKNEIDITISHNYRLLDLIRIGYLQYSLYTTFACVQISMGKPGLLIHDFNNKHHNLIVLLRRLYATLIHNDISKYGEGKTKELLFGMMLNNPKKYPICNIKLNRIITEKAPGNEFEKIIEFDEFVYHHSQQKTPDHTPLEMAFIHHNTCIFYPKDVDLSDEMLEVIDLYNNSAIPLNIRKMIMPIALEYNDSDGWILCLIEIMIIIDNIELTRPLKNMVNSLGKTHKEDGIKCNECNKIATIIQILKTRDEKREEFLKRVCGEELYKSIERGYKFYEQLYVQKLTAHRKKCKINPYIAIIIKELHIRI
jgi:hypothetical protein